MKSIDFKLAQWMMIHIIFLYTNFSQAQTPADDFVTVWDLSIAGSSPTGLSFGVGTAGTVNYTWETIPAGTSGSGTFSGSTATITGLPASAKIRLRIQPTNFRRINIRFGTDRSRLLDVEQWGTVAWSSMLFAFWGCINLDITSTDQPNLSRVSEMSFMFTGCNNLKGPQNISNWNTENVNDMSYLFYDASSFNQPIGSWSTGNVTNMMYMFERATAFNQPIGSWNTGKVTEMSYMFYYARSFNQPINSWNTRNVTNMSFMFQGATSFNQPLGDWSLNPTVNMSSMFNFSSGMDCLNYSATLIGWANNPNTPNGRSLGADSRTYSTNSVASRQTLIDKSWTITGDVASTGECVSSGNPTLSNEFIYEFLLYPNPAKHSVQVNGIKEAEMELINMQGQTLKTGRVGESFDVSALRKGMYYVKIIHGNKTKMLKLMVG